jgi:hypothetical protein
MLNLLTLVLQTELTSGPWGELTVGGILMAGLIVVWRVNTKLASQNEILHIRIAAIQEQRAKDAVGETKAMTEALNSSTQAMQQMTAAVHNNSRLLERFINAKNADTD